MILYHAITNYHVLEMMLYKKMFHDNEEVILILPDFIKGKLPFYKELEEEGFFDKVYLFPYWNSRYEFADDESAIERKFKEIVGGGIEAFDEIYISGTHYCFTKYVLSENRKFYNFEDSSGSLCLYNRAVEEFTKMDYEMGTWCKENDILSGKNKNIIKTICDLSAQSIELEIDNVMDFNVSEVLKNTDSAYIDKIKKFFRAPENIQAYEKTALLLTQHFANIQLMTKEEQINMYQLIADFYIDGYDLVIKKHPDDWVVYDEYLESAGEIYNIFPLELMPYISIDGGFDIAVTVSSASIRNIDKFIQEKIYCGIYFIYHYKEMIKTYYTLKLLEKNNKKIVFCCVYEDIVKNIAKYSDENTDVNNMTFIENIDDLEFSDDFAFVLGYDINKDDLAKVLNELNKKGCDIFLLDNSYDGTVDGFIKFKIEKIKVKDDALCDLDEEYIYIKSNYDYSNVELSKTLKQTGIVTTLKIE